MRTDKTKAELIIENITLKRELRDMKVKISKKRKHWWARLIK